MKQFIKTDFDLVYEELNEIYAADFKAENDSYYHFYSNLLDLINSLDTETIYSTKNDKQDNVRQYDQNIPEGASYVCMTNTLAGKQAVLRGNRRPVGISFTKADLINTCARHKYQFDPNVEYNQFAERGNYKTPKKGAPVILANTEEYGRNPFKVYSIGELSDGEYFICGGQGADKLWPTKIFYNKETYEELKKWFIANMNEPSQKHIYYWFVNGSLGNITKAVKYNGKNCPIEVDGNLNHNYKPRALNDYKQTISFNLTGSMNKTFKEIIGYGPIEVVNDKNNTLLSMWFVQGVGKEGYKGPAIFGKNIDTGEFAAETSTQAGNVSKKNGATQINLFADEKLFKDLSSIYTENEHRVYILNGNDMRFSPSDVSTIILPNIFEAAKGIQINLVALIDALINNETLDVGKLLGLGIISIDDADLLKIVNKLIKLLQGPYAHVGIEMNGIGKTVYRNFKTSNTFIRQNKDYQRKLINGWPDLHTVEETIGPEKEITYKADIKMPDGTVEQARLGSEIILTAEDENHKKYVLFVYKVKSDSFMELPGGGMDNAPVSYADFESLIKDRLKFKCNINQSDISNLRDTGKALLLHEVGIMKKQNGKYPYEWSYYRLYAANYNKVLTEDELNNKYDNNSEAKALGKRGYVAYMRWLPVDSLELNSSIRTRYANIIPMIKQN